MPPSSPQADGSASASAGATATTSAYITTALGKIPFDRVPEFDGSIQRYREYRKKVEIYAARMALVGREEAVGLDLMQSLKGKAWEAVEDMYTNLLTDDKGWLEVLKVLDHVFSTTLGRSSQRSSSSSSRQQDRQKRP